MRVGVEKGNINGVSIGGAVAEGFSVITTASTEGASVQVGGNWLIGVAVAVGNSMIARGVGGGKGLKGELGLTKMDTIAIPRHNVINRAARVSIFQKPSKEPRAARLFGAGVDLDAILDFSIAAFPRSWCQDFDLALAATSRQPILNRFHLQG